MNRLETNASNKPAAPRLASKPVTGAAPDFKPVALPALAAAVRSAQSQPAAKPAADLPAILRKDAYLD